jgi:4-amino-4-deoxy-L-arabinose transferase-like glycosyltransferase
VILISAIFLPIYAQASGTVSSAIITEGFATHFTTIWGIAKWLMQAILGITAAVLAFKTATKGQGEDRTGGWIAVISIILVGIGLTFVPTIMDTLFGIEF